VTRWLSSNGFPARIAERLTDARAIDTSDRDFLLAQLPAGRPTCVVHGDAWSGNCAITDDGRAVLLDFERTAGGPPEWDLTSGAVALETAGTMSEETYSRFCDAYGYDVRQWAGYPTLRGIRELRMTTFPPVQRRYRITVALPADEIHDW